MEKLFRVDSACLPYFALQYSNTPKPLEISPGNDIEFLSGSENKVFWI
jgi:hypothetical protein